MVMRFSVIGTSALFPIWNWYFTSNAPYGKPWSPGPESSSIPICGSGMFAFVPDDCGEEDEQAVRTKARMARRRMNRYKRDEILLCSPPMTSIMRQEWHHLLFLHWEIPAMELQALIPPTLTIDTFEGKAYVGMIPFTMSNVRPLLTPPIPWLSSFHEVNVRTYV